MFEQRRYEFLLESEEPVAHHSESFGNSAIFMRRKVQLPDGTMVNRPTVTGDTMRHGLREAIVYVFLRAAGLLDAPALTEAALRLLFAGGMLTGKGDGSAIKLDQYREMVDLVPPIRLLGGCAENRAIPGAFQVGDARLVCEEEMPFLPEWVHDWIADRAVHPARAHVEEVQRVRMDPTLNPGKRILLSDGERARSEGRLLASEAASAEGDARARDDAKSSMMPRRVETVIQGSLWFWRTTATVYTPLDVDTLDAMHAAFLADCRVGGKKGTGHGLLRVARRTVEEIVDGKRVPRTVYAARNIDLHLPERRTTDAAGMVDPKATTGSILRAHVAERKERIVSLLTRVDA